MKTLLNYPIAIYLVAGIACLAMMIIIDYLLGAEAEHLNAWVIANRLLGNKPGIPDSLAIQKLGLAGASILMIALNMVLGPVLILMLKGVIRFIHFLH